MQEIHFLRWRLCSDAEITRRASSLIARGGAVECGCLPCTNYIRVGSAVFPEVALALLERLGIDRSKDVEVVHYSRLPNGLHRYGGWFHAAAEILEGRDGWKTTGGSGVPDFEEVTSTFSLGLSSTVHLRSRGFAALTPLIQVEFLAQIPWVLEEPYLES